MDQPTDQLAITWDPMQVAYDEPDLELNENPTDAGCLLDDGDTDSLPDEAGNDRALNPYKDVPLCRFYSERGECYKPGCTFSHIFTTSTGHVIGHEALLPKQGSHVLAQVSHVVNPDNFYCILPRGCADIEEANLEQLEENEEQLYVLRTALRAHYKNSAPPPSADEHEFKPGEIVAVMCDIDKWYRARILGNDETEDSDNKKLLHMTLYPNITVFFVDYGMRGNVSSYNIRPIENRFLKLPFQAVNCRLSGVASTGADSVNGAWSLRATTEFHSLTKGKDLVAFIRGSVNACVEVSLYIPDKQEQGMQDIGEILISSGFAKKAESVAGKIAIQNQTIIPG